MLLLLLLLLHAATSSSAIPAQPLLLRPIYLVYIVGGPTEEGGGRRHDWLTSMTLHCSMGVKFPTFTCSSIYMNANPTNIYVYIIHPAPSELNVAGICSPLLWQKLGLLNITMLVHFACQVVKLQKIGLGFWCQFHMKKHWLIVLLHSVCLLRETTAQA